MSLTIQQLLADAKALQSRLSDDETKLNGLVSDAQTVYSTIESMREYHEDVEELNEEAHQRPRVQLVAGIQQENRHIRELQHENRELKAALEEHQNALDVIMSKYRQQVLKLLQVNKASRSAQVPSRDYSKVVDKCHQKMHEMVLVMKKAVNMDDAALPKQQELITRLMTENKTLRELLDISEKNGTLPPGSRKLPLKKEKQTQTDSQDERHPEEPLPSSVVEACPACGHPPNEEAGAPDEVSSPIHNQPGLMDVSIASSSCDTDTSIDLSDGSGESVIMSPSRFDSHSKTNSQEAPSSVPAVVLT